MPLVNNAGVGEVVPSFHRPLPRALCPKSREAESCDSRQNVNTKGEQCEQGAGAFGPSSLPSESRCELKQPRPFVTA